MKTEKKEKIFKAALNMIKKTGVHSLAMGQLSKDSGIAAGTFYHYFTSKDVMLQETFLYCHKRAAAIGAKGIKGAEVNKANYQTMVKDWYNHFAKNKTELHFIQESEAGYSVTPNAIRESFMFYSETFSFFTQGIDKQLLRNIDPKLMLSIIYQTIYSVVKYERIFEITSTDADIDDLLEYIWHGMKYREKKGSKD